MRLVDGESEPVAAACRFLDHLVDRGFSPHTICAYAYDLRRLFTFLAAEGMDWREFRGPDALRLLAFLRRAPSRRPAQRLGLTVVVGGPEAPGSLLSPAHCLALAASAVDKVRGRVDTQTEALFAVTHAHALAKAGQRQEAVREVERAGSALSSAKGDEVPFWALSWGPPAATVHSRTAKVYETLGDRRRAAAMYGAAATSRPPGTYARIVALDLVAQAEMQAAEGSIEQACATWGRAIDHMDGVQSNRTRKAVGNMRRDLSRFRTRGLRCATELDERARDFLTARR